MKFGEILLKNHYITESQLQEALREQQEIYQNMQYSEPLGNILFRNGILTEEQHNRALIEYYQHIAEDPNVEDYVRESAKSAYLSMTKKSSENSLSKDTKMALITKIYEYQEKISEAEKSIQTLSKFGNKPTIAVQINNYKNMIKDYIQKIDNIRKDIEKFS